MKAVILVGHGGVPTDFPESFLKELKVLEGQRRSKGIEAVSEREIELDHKIRYWPRTRSTDPYQWGLEQVGQKLRERLKDIRVALAYNEFCAPSLEQAIAQLAEEGYTQLTIMTTMFTPGGAHSEIEIPAIIQRARKRYPSIQIQYAWPFDLNDAADFLISHLKRIRQKFPSF
jgi:sirohydrochlorin cobaltochelatase